MINEKKNVVDDNNVLFFLLCLFCFYIVNSHVVNNHAKYMVYKYPHVKYIVYKYSLDIVYIISCNVVKCFSHVVCVCDTKHFKKKKICQVSYFFAKKMKLELN